MLMLISSNWVLDMERRDDSDSGVIDNVMDMVQ